MGYTPRHFVVVDMENRNKAMARFSDLPGSKDVMVENNGEWILYSYNLFLKRFAVEVAGFEDAKREKEYINKKARI